MLSLFITSTIGVVLVAIGLMAEERRARMVCIGIGGFLIVASLMSCAKRLHDPDAVVVIDLLPPMP